MILPLIPVLICFSQTEAGSIQVLSVPNVTLTKADAAKEDPQKQEKRDLIMIRYGLVDIHEQTSCLDIGM